MSENRISDEILLIPMPSEVEHAEDYGYEPLRDDEMSEGKKNAKVIAARLSEVKTGLKEFLSQVEDLFKDTPTLLGDFNLQEVEVSAGVTTNGKFVLFGVGVEGGLDGGLRFTFKRASQNE